MKYSKKNLVTSPTSRNSAVDGTSPPLISYKSEYGETRIGMESADVGEGVASETLNGGSTGAVFWMS